MKYFVVGDTHACFDFMQEALKNAGFFDYAGDKKLVVLGDLMDRGAEPKEMQSFMMSLLKNNQLILISGNHDCMARDCIDDPSNEFYKYSKEGTFDTLLTLTGMSLKEALNNPYAFKERARKTDFISTLIPSSHNFYETKKYIFVHGWIPTKDEGYDSNWRKASDEQWDEAKWINGIYKFKSGMVVPGKIIVFGHRSASVAHFLFDNEGSKYGLDANYKPYYNIVNDTGIIAMDSCVVKSNFVNCIVLEDEEI